MKLFAYIAQIFSNENCASFGRWATAATVATGCWSMVHLVRVNHQLPDAVGIAALAAWMTAPYGITKVSALLAGSPAPTSPPTS